MEPRDKDYTAELNNWLKEEREKYRDASPREQKRKWAGLWFPKELWFDEDLEPLEKLLLLEINSLDTDKLGCVASNKYLSKFLKTSERNIQRYILKLKKKNYIYQEKFDGRIRVLHSYFKDKLRQKTK